MLLLRILHYGRSERLGENNNAGISKDMTESSLNRCSEIMTCMLGTAMS
jgi:hypothetical protein